MKRPEPSCPIRPTDACTLCQPGATGPEDCALVWLVRNDPDLAEEWARVRREAAAERRARRSRTPEATASAGI